MPRDSGYRTVDEMEANERDLRHHPLHPGRLIIKQTKKQS